MYLKITQINADKGTIFNIFKEEIEKGITRKKLFEQLRALYGKAVSKVYIGESNPMAIGWVFHKKIKYSDSATMFMQETWVVLEETKVTAISLNKLP